MCVYVYAVHIIIFEGEIIQGAFILFKEQALMFPLYAFMLTLASSTHFCFIFLFLYVQMYI